MTEKICPVCNRPNLSTATRCWYCQSLLEDEGVVSASSQEERSSEKDAEIGDNEVPEWLARIRQRKAIEEMQQTKSLSPEALAPRGEPKNQPENQSEDQTGTDQAEPADLPPWLEGLGTRAPSEGVTRSLEPEKDREPENYDWLEKLQAWKARDQEEAEIPPDEVLTPSNEANNTDSTEDWLTGFLAPQEENRDMTASLGPEPASEISTANDEQSEPERAETEEPLPSQDETYDFSAENYTHPTGEEKQEPPQLTGEIDAQPKIDEPAFIPPPEEPQESLKAESAPENSDLDWLTHYQDTEPEEIPGKAEAPQEKIKTTHPGTPFLGVQKSDWGEPIEDSSFAPEEEAPEEEEVEPAVLPAWMQNLRPIESIPQSSLAQPSEPLREGPLAGIEGALEGSMLGGAFEKPPIYSSKVQVSDRHSLRAELLQNLLEEPAESKPAAEVKAPARGRFLKVLVSLILLVAVFAVLILAPGTSLLPVLFPPETANAYRLINELPGDKPVLVAADFEAGLSEEIGYTSQSVLEHLMLRGVPLAVLSTNPVGSTLMDGLLIKSQGLVSSYDASTRVVNFGYLPGGSVGIQGLGSDLRSTLAYDRDLQLAWTQPVLQNVQSLADLGALVVVTDDADMGRYWVEQVQPSLKGVPLILVTSAQAAPMLQPYYASGQVSAVVSGISGGSAYEQIMNLPGSSSYFYGAYQVLTLLVIGLILVGGIVSLIKPAAPGLKG